MKRSIGILFFLSLILISVGCNNNSPTTTETLTNPYDISLSGSINQTDSYEVDSFAGLMIDENGEAGLYGNYQGSLIGEMSLQTMDTIDPIFDTDELPAFSWPSFIPGRYVNASLDHGMFLAENHDARIENEFGTAYYSILDDQGTDLIDPEKYTYIDYFYEGIARVSTSVELGANIVNQQMMADKRDNRITYGYLCYEENDGIISLSELYETDNQRFSFAGIFQGNYAIVSIGVGDDQKFGVIDKNGNYVLDPTFDYIEQEIVDGKVIVANNITINDYNSFATTTIKNDISYYSQEVGVYDLMSGEMVIENTHEIITCIDENLYFVWDSETLNEILNSCAGLEGEELEACQTIYNITESDDITNYNWGDRPLNQAYGFLINLSDGSETMLDDPYYNLVRYDNEYWIGLYLDKMYLIDSETKEAVTEYERYRSLMYYFHIDQFKNNGTAVGGPLYTGDYSPLQYNFNTYIYSQEKKVDFIRENLYYMVDELDHPIMMEIESEEQEFDITGSVIDSSGNIIFSLEEGFYPYAGDFATGIEEYNTFIIYPDSLIAVQHPLSESQYAYLNLDGEVVVDGLTFASPFYNGSAICSKQIELSGKTVELYYTIDNEGDMKQLDLGINYFSDGQMPWDESYTRSGRISLLSRGVYCFKVDIYFPDSNSQTGYTYIINSYGDVLTPSLDVNWMQMFSVNDLKKYPEHYQDLFDGTVIQSDVILLDTGMTKNLLVVVRDLFQTTADSDKMKYDDRIQIDSHYVAYPFIFQFNDPGQLEIYLNGTLVSESSYIWNEAAQHLYFDQTYLDDLSENILSFEVVSTDQTVEITVYKENAIANAYQYMDSIYCESERINYDTSIAGDIYIQIFNIDSSVNIDVLYLNDVNISDQIISVDGFFDNTASVQISKDAFTNLNPGIYYLYLGNSDRLVKYIIIII